MTENLIKNILSEILFGSRICESMLQRSMVDSLYKELMLEKLLVGEPVTIEELRKLLNTKVLNFEFVKLDGEVRPARGTTMMKYIPDSEHPWTGKPKNDKVTAFYDLDKGAWRSVSNKSKEIVLRFDDVTGKPSFTITDKTKQPVDPDKEETIKSDDGEVNQRPLQPKAEPVVSPSIKPDDTTFPEPDELDTEPEVKSLNIKDKTKVASNVKDDEVRVAPDRKDLKFPTEEPESAEEVKQKVDPTPEPQELPPVEDITFPDEDFFDDDGEDEDDNIIK